MTRRPIALLVLGGLTSLALIVAGIIPAEVAAANKTANKSGKSAKKPIRNPKFDPTAEKVDLFDAVDGDQLAVKLIPNDAMSGTVLIENKTDKPLTVKVPEALVGVSVHSQFGGGGMGGGGMGGGGMGGGGMGGGGGGGQAMGGGMGGGGMMGGGGGWWWNDGLVAEGCSRFHRKVLSPCHSNPFALNTARRNPIRAASTRLFP